MRTVHAFTARGQLQSNAQLCRCSPVGKGVQCTASAQLADSAGFAAHLEHSVHRCGPLVVLLTVYGGYMWLGCTGMRRTKLNTLASSICHSSRWSLGGCR